MLECLRHPRVELRPGAPAQLSNRVIMPEDRAIRTLRRHRRVGICDGDDARRKRDLLCAKAIGVPLAVEVLVAAAYQLRGALERRRCGENPLADDRVLM